MKDILSCIHPRKMTATCSRVVVIQNLFSFLVAKASLENEIDTTSIQSLIQDEVVFFMVTDTTTIVMGYRVEIFVFGYK